MTSVNKYIFEKSEHIYDILSQFFQRNKYILLITILVGLYINAIDIFNFKINIDAERFMVVPDGNIYKDLHQRYGTYLLLHLFPFLQYHTISQITGIILLSLAAIISIDRHNIPHFTKTLYCILLVSFPNFSFLEYFYYQSTYNFIGIFLAVISYKLLEHSKYIYHYFVPIILLTLALSSYPACFAVFLTVMVINIILDYKNNYNYKLAIKHIIIGFIIAIISYILYYASINILTTSTLHFQNRYENIKTNIDIFTRIKQTLITIKDILLSRGFFGSHLFTLPATLLYIISTILLYKKMDIKKYIFYILLICLLFLSVFSIHIMVYYNIPSRGTLALGFLYAFAIVLFLDIKDIKLHRLIAILFVFISIIYHANYLTQYNTATILQYEDDKRIAYDLINRINKAAPEIYNKQYYITFVGKLGLTQQQRPFSKKVKDVYGATIFAWDRGNPYRQIYLLYLMGLPTNVKLDNSQDSINIANKIPMYPDKDSIIVKENHIYVRLR